MLGPGSLVGHYRVVRAIGHGGMGVVYLAEHTLLDRRVALKVLRPDHSRDPELIERFFTEARTVSNLGHPHIVEVTDCGITPDGVSYFVMELLEGENLFFRMRRDGPWPLARSLHVVLQLADALAACHAVGVVHRDLKPNNVMLVPHRGDPFFVKLFDFGIVKLLHGSRRTLSDPRSVLGTPLYMAPEQCLAGPIDHRVDIYALGVMLYELLTGENPFVGKSWAQVVMMHIQEPFPDVRDRRPDLAPGTEDIIARATAKDTGDRFATMEAMRHAIVELIVTVVDHPSQEIGHISLQGDLRGYPGTSASEIAGLPDLGAAEALAETPTPIDAELLASTTEKEIEVSDTEKELHEADTPRVRRP